MSKGQNDFNPEDLIKASEDHEKTISELSASVKKLKNRLGDNAALAGAFKEAFDSDKKMDAVLKELLCNLIRSDESLKDAIKEAVKKIDRDWWNNTWKKTLGAIGAIALVILGAVLQSWLGK